jgi:hypothetical protein
MLGDGSASVYCNRNYLQKAFSGLHLSATSRLGWKPRSNGEIRFGQYALLAILGQWGYRLENNIERPIYSESKNDT